MMQWNSRQLLLIALVAWPCTLATRPDQSLSAETAAEKYCSAALAGDCAQAMPNFDEDSHVYEPQTYTLGAMWSDFRLILSIGAGFFFMHMMEASRDCGSSSAFGKKFQMYPYAM
mmetsp:Transcript_18517/g.43308  ORF Transcript_18517/g.43308 Transcript_18517/m.43308 type:complete len:115 (-) Transcript_18517:112-456(-)|eukprot:CAMPEP_0178388300 /NCGR_PEP_ID=MMETSP0689_2-20121128/9518_1 /TAXON_ID=160604 /ORGANISM="Amphidinium massartii, Strain CS-259" /LENGTH=114 /DNA_ID=CAMNT_0020008691 /DNA_START=101 /DNA_END=445 /DNA_ORIENTATION=+